MSGAAVNSGISGSLAIAYPKDSTTQSPLGLSV